MKKSLFAIMLVVFSGMANAAETVDGKFACRTEQWFQDFMKFAAANDTGSLQAYLDSRKCMEINGGLTVTVLEYPGMLSGQWLVSYKGEKFYIQRDGVKD